MKKYCIVPYIIAGTLLAGCSANQQNENQEENQELPVFELSEQATTLHREYVGELEAVRNVEIRARVSGYLNKIFVDEGQAVKKGQPLFQINDEEIRNELTRASASLKNMQAEAKSAELEIKRVGMLVDKKIISPSELDVAKAKLEAAKANIENAESARRNASIKLAQTQIKAPFDGVINRIPFKLGSLIDEGTLLTTVSDIGEIYAYFDVSEREYLEYIKKRNAEPQSDLEEVELVLADDSHYQHKGKIETMESIFEDNAGTIAFRARFPNPDKLLRHGSSGKVRLSNQVDKAVLVPQKAVFEIQDKNYVYVVDTGNTVSMRSFVPEGRLSQFYLVASGLEPGEQVVYEGIQELREGMHITPQLMSSDSLLSLVKPTAGKAGSL